MKGDKFNKITEYLDDLVNFDKCGFYRHYMMYGKYDISYKCLLIRIPGATVGNVILDDNNTIKEIVLNTELHITKYTEDMVKLVNDKFVGTVYDFSKDIEQRDDPKYSSYRGTRSARRKVMAMSVLIYHIAKCELCDNNETLPTCGTHLAQDMYGNYEYYIPM